MSSANPAPQRLLTGYVPSLPLTIIASAVFTVLAGIFIFRFVRTRNHKWMLCLTIGSFFMAVGFYVRIPMTTQPGSLIIYIVHTLFTLLSPCAFLAHIYLILPRLATYLEADDCLFLRPRLIARTFVWIDVTVFIIQAGGGGLTAMQDVNLANIGSKIATVGLVIQCVSFGTFCVLALVFAYKLKKRYPQKWAKHNAGPSSPAHYQEVTTWRNDWRIMYYAMLYNCVLILVRCVFRVAEFSEGYDGKLRTTEVYIYVLDTLPLALAIAIWALIWPPRYLGDGRHSLYSAAIGSGDGSEMGMTSAAGYHHGPGRDHRLAYGEAK